MSEVEFFVLAWFEEIHARLAWEQTGARSVSEGRKEFSVARIQEWKEMAANYPPLLDLDSVAVLDRMIGLGTASYGEVRRIFEILEEEYRAAIGLTLATC